MLRMQLDASPSSYQLGNLAGGITQVTKISCDYRAGDHTHRGGFRVYSWLQPLFNTSIDAVYTKGTLGNYPDFMSFMKRPRLLGQFLMGCSSNLVILAF